jgi:hypothetical protein
MEDIIKMMVEHPLYMPLDISKYDKIEIELYKQSIVYRYTKLCNQNNIVPELDFENDFENACKLYFDFSNGIEFYYKVKNILKIQN